MRVANTTNTSRGQPRYAETKTRASREEKRFTRAQLLSSKYFANRRDAISAVVGVSEVLSIEEASERVDKFMKGVG